MAYLYGASVQGIQEYIFATNKLKEIIGASEIVKRVDDLITEYQEDKTKILVKAGGNIKAIFDSEKELEKIVYEFEKKVLQMAYGITISQAVVKFDGSYPSPEDFSTLEEKLKIQRNKPKIELDLSLNILKLAPTTAKPVVAEERVQKKSTPIDTSTKQKRDANNKNDEYNDISKLANKNNKIAIIHADGNGLGKLVPTLGKNLSEFSKNLDKATNKAFDEAKEKTPDIKIRKVILGGDDMTVICDGDSALEFIKNYLELFEKYTKEHTGHHLTACAGITYCNKKYPFHYGVALAEELCSYAKDETNREASAVMFHNIQSANVDSYEKFIEDELTVKNDKKAIHLNYGPYYLDSTKGASLESFINLVKAFGKKGSPLSSLRRWISELYFSDEYATAMIERIDDMADLNSEFKKEPLNNAFKALHPNLSLRYPFVLDRTPIYDILQIDSVAGERR